MKEEKEIKISGYETMYQNYKTSNSGGIVATVEDNENNNHASKGRNRSRAGI